MTDRPPVPRADPRAIPERELLSKLYNDMSYIDSLQKDIKKNLAHIDKQKERVKLARTRVETYQKELVRRYLIANGDKK